MKDLENHHIGRSEPNKWKECGNNENADICSMFGCLGTIIMLIVLAISAFFTSCSRTIVDERPVYLHDTLTIQQLRIDSIMHRDSVYVETYTKGDTVFRVKFVERWRERIKEVHDTLTSTREVPVEVRRTEIKEVEKPLTWWQKTIRVIGYASLIVFVLMIAKRLQSRYLWLDKLAAFFVSIFRK